MQHPVSARGGVAGSSSSSSTLRCAAAAAAPQLLLPRAQRQRRTTPSSLPTTTTTTFRRCSLLVGVETPRPPRDVSACAKPKKSAAQRAAEAALLAAEVRKCKRKRELGTRERERGELNDDDGGQRENKKKKTTTTTTRRRFLPFFSFANLILLLPLSFLIETSKFNHPGQGSSRTPTSPSGSGVLFCCCRRIRRRIRLFVEIVVKVFRPRGARQGRRRGRRGRGTDRPLRHPARKRLDHVQKRPCAEERHVGSEKR